jgi:chromosome segregation ATPase
MKWTTRVFGVLILLLGFAGIIVCLAGIAATWKVRNRVDNVVVTTFSRVDEAMTRLEDRAQRTNERIDDVQESLHGLNDRVQHRVAELRNVPKEEAADIDELERQLYARVQQVIAWIGFMQSTVDLVEQLLDMAESTSVFLQDDSRTTQDLISSLRDGREEIAQTSKLVEEVQQGLIEIRARRNVEENAKQITSLSSRIDASLTKVQGYGQKFEAGVTRSRAHIEVVGDQVRWRLTVIAVTCSLFLLWMAVGQLSLAIQGRKTLLHR